MVEMWSAAVVVCYPHSMPSLNIRKVGDGPRCYAVWLDGWPIMLAELEPEGTCEDWR